MPRRMNSSLPWQRLVVGFFVLPLLEFVVNFMRAPVRQLEDDVAALGHELQHLSAAVRPEPAVIRAALNDLRAEARSSLRQMKAASNRGTYWRPWESAPDFDDAWKKQRDQFATQPEYRLLYDRSSDAADEVRRILGLRAFRMLSRTRRVEDSDQLPAAVAAVELAHETLDGAFTDLSPPTGPSV